MAAFGALTALAACSRATDVAAAPTVTPLNKPKGFWRELISPAAYNVLFEERTEPAFSSPLDKETRTGTFICAACYLPQFEPLPALRG